MSTNITKQIEQILEAETRMAREAIDEAAAKTAKATVAALKQTSPKRSGRYARSWKTKQQATSAGNKAHVVHSEKHYRLTHLLEKGHALRQGGRTRAYPHIKQAEEQAIADFEQELVKRIERG